MSGQSSYWKEKGKEVQGNTLKVGVQVELDKPSRWVFKESIGLGDW
jgi:hypothetical protein